MTVWPCEDYLFHIDSISLRADFATIRKTLIMASTEVYSESVKIKLAYLITAVSLNLKIERFRSFKFAVFSA